MIAIAPSCDLSLLELCVRHRRLSKCELADTHTHHTYTHTHTTRKAEEGTKKKRKRKTLFIPHHIHLVVKRRRVCISIYKYIYIYIPSTFISLIFQEYIGTTHIVVFVSLSSIFGFIAPCVFLYLDHALLLPRRDGDGKKTRLPTTVTN